MLVFLDDSGDPGFKVGKGSTPCFVIALVIFDDKSASIGSTNGLGRAIWAAGQPETL